MPLLIDPAIIAQTVCDKEFNCLTADRKFLCKVEMNLGENYYVRCRHEAYCRHQEDLTDLKKCHCPVRKAIFHNYGI